MARVIDPDDQGEIGLPCHNGGKEVYVWDQDIPLFVLLLPRPVNKANGKLLQLVPGRSINGSDPSGVKVCVTLQVKNHGQMRTLQKAEGIQNG